MGGICGRDSEIDRLPTEVGTAKKFDNKYQVIEHIGEGKYGEVYKCLDIVNQNIVVYESSTVSSDSDSTLLLNTLSSLQRIKHSNNNDNVARCHEIHELDSVINLVFEYSVLGLQKFISISNMSGKPHMIKRFLQHMLSSLAYCHQFGIYHQDLKPANFMVFLEGDTSQLKLANFGLFKLSKQDFSYRAPEIILLSALDHKDHYSKVADIWSVGCIFVEMLKGSPLFSTTSNTPKDHLISIFSLLGLPTERTWPGITKYLQEFHLDDATSEPKNLAVEFPILGAHGFDLLYRMLCLDPKQRITVEDALMHIYLYT